MDEPLKGYENIGKRHGETVGKMEDQRNVIKGHGENHGKLKGKWRISGIWWESGRENKEICERTPRKMENPMLEG